MSPGAAQPENGWLDGEADPVEVLMAECLQAPEDRQQDAFAAAAAQHPEHASELRRRLRALHDIGLARPHRDHDGDDDREGDSSGDTPTPRRLGDFELVRPLGGGGMGVVWLARQLPLRREVALKLVRAEQLWFEGSRERFRREVEVVASLQHPGIVPIYTFGEQDGVPFYAMPLVPGATIAERLQDLPSKMSERLTGAPFALPEATWVDACCSIACQVADALQHAHERGIVHRDVKPSNVMVTPAGEAMLLDFGLASREGGDTLTRTGAQPGSLAYMSPEQVRGVRLDPRTDVYSLGVTLYEMLASRPPFAASSHESLRGTILDGRPPALRDLDRRVPWDVETIVRVAMAPEPEHRYRSAAAMAADLRAFLERRPIAARRAGPLLRLRRLVQRHPAWAAAVCLGLLLVTGVPTSMFLVERRARREIAREAEEAHRARQEMEHAAATAENVTSFLVGVFAEASPDHARGREVPARVLLDRGVARIRDDLQQQPELRARLLQVMGNVYTNLGLYTDAEPLLRDAVAVLAQAPANDPARLLDCRGQLGRLYYLLGRAGDAEAVQRGVLEAARARRAGGGDPDDQRVADAMLQLGQTLLLRSGGEAEARRLLEGAVAMCRRLAADRSDGAIALAGALDALASFLRDRDHPSRAVPLFREELALIEHELPANHPRRLQALLNMARTLHQVGETSAAGDRLREAERIAVHIFEPRHPTLAQVQEELALHLMRTGDHGRARTMLDEALAAYRACYVAPHPVLAHGLCSLAMLHLRAGDYKECTVAALQAEAMYAELAAGDHIDHACMLASLAEARLYIGDLPHAEEDARRALAMHRRLAHNKRDALAQSMATLALVLATRHQHQEAEPLATEALALVRDWYPPEHACIAQAECTLGHVLALIGKGAEAERHALASLAIWERQPNPPPVDVGYALFVQAWARSAQGDLDGAIALHRRALELYRRHLRPDHPLLGLPLNELGVLLARRKHLDEAAQLLERALELRRSVGVAGDSMLALGLFNCASVHERRHDWAAAESFAWQCLDALLLGADREDRKGGYCVDLLLRLLRRPGRAPAASDAARLAAAAAQLLPEGNASLRAVESFQSGLARD